jgi:hypothetical protein
LQLLRRSLAALLVAVAIVAFVVASFDVPDEAISVARGHAVSQRAGEAELGVVLSLGDEVSTGIRGDSACVVFAAEGAPMQARVGVLLRPAQSGWAAWFSRAAEGRDLDCAAMLAEERLLDTNLTPYVE